LPEKYLGIDIRDEFVALTLVAKTWGGMDIVRSHWFRLLTEEGNRDTEDQFARELEDFLKIGKVNPKAVILGLPRQNCTLQTFDLPSTDPEALGSMIQLELDRHFPFPLNTMSVSYHVVPLSPHRSHVIAAAAKKERVAEYLNWLAGSGLKPDVVDLSTASQINLLNANGEIGSELQAIVDISSNRVDVSLIKGKTLVASRSALIPDEDFKKIFFYHDLPEIQTSRVTKNFCGFLTEILESTLFGCKTLENEESITQILLFGGGHGWESLAVSIQTETGVETKAILPTILKKDAPISFKPSFQMTSLGLALRPILQDPIELNFHPAYKPRVKRKSNWKPTAVLLVMVLTVLAGILVGQIYRNENTLASLNRQLKELQPLARQLEKIDRQYATLSEYTETLNAIERQSPLKLPLLQELSKKLPKDTWVTRISIRQNQVEIQGYSASASKLIPQLEDSEFLKDTQFKGSIITKALGKRFTIRSTMEPRG